jgi:predicted GH43/DUF377 family glycosyl hydrolase
MLVVIPICAKDWLLAADNLEWALQLEGGERVDFDALISYDTATEQHSVEHVEAVARQLFRSVRVYCYNAPHETTWPEAPNTAWQSVALHLGIEHPSQPWFWWEADATPLKAGWLAELEAAYVAGGKPFAGHIVDDMGHMNGVAVYPGLVAKYGPKALYCRAAPWDTVLREDTIDQTTPLNSLIYHFPKLNGLKCQVKDPAVPKRLLELGYVLFHFCNDGSILKVLQGETPFDYGEHPSVKVFGLSDIGRRVDESEALWHKEALRLHKAERGIISYDECRKALPSLKGQAHANGWEGGMFDLISDKGIGHFNSGFCRDDTGTYWLVTRRWQRREHMERSWHSTLQAYPARWDATTKTFVLGEAINLTLTTDPFEEAEDPRVIFRNGKFYVSYCSWSQRSVYVARQVLAEFDREWKPLNSLKVPYGFNDYKGDKYTKVAEKNWVWFRHDETWHFVYQASPHVVVAVEKKPVAHETKNRLNWNYGDIRGGTPPVRVGDEYFTFFHSSLPWKRRQKRYYAGAYAFEAKAPFRITRITPLPLLAGSENDTRINHGPLVVFPCGALFENDGWTVTSGVNDEATAWTKIPHVDLLGKMVNI